MLVMGRVGGAHDHAIQVELEQLPVVGHGVLEGELLLDPRQQIRVAPRDGHHLDVIPGREDGHVVDRGPPPGADEPEPDLAADHRPPDCPFRQRTDLRFMRLPIRPR